MDLQDKLNKVAKDQMDYATDNGSSVLSTCDERGWDKDVWNNKKEIIKKLRDCGYKVSVKVGWGVTDIITTKIK
jgi:hypothetical protein